MLGIAQLECFILQNILNVIFPPSDCDFVEWLYVKNADKNA